MSPRSRPNPSPSGDRRRQVLRRMLVRRYREVRAFLNGVQWGGRIESESFGDVEAEDAVLYAVNDSQWRTLAQIERALERLDQGTYGICEECKQPIPEPRLRALPFADLCIACKDREEEAPLAAPYGQARVWRDGPGGVWSDEDDPPWHRSLTDAAAGRPGRALPATSDADDAL